MNIPTIREQAIAQMPVPFQAEAAVIYGLLLAFTCWLYYAVAVT